MREGGEGEGWWWWWCGLCVDDECLSINHHGSSELEWQNTWQSDSRRPHPGTRRLPGRSAKNASKMKQKIPFSAHDHLRDEQLRHHQLSTATAGHGPVVAQRRACPPKSGQELHLWNLHRYLHCLGQTPFRKTIWHANTLVQAQSCTVCTVCTCLCCRRNCPPTRRPSLRHLP